MRYITQTPNKHLQNKGNPRPNKKSGYIANEAISSSLAGSLTDMLLQIAPQDYVFSSQDYVNFLCTIYLKSTINSIAGINKLYVYYIVYVISFCFVFVCVDFVCLHVNLVRTKDFIFLFFIYDYLTQKQIY